ncbi:MAG: rod shape-determining protein [Actinobacteria bacterium]|nr:rod shape-determining protein [Actinomycetota bacterium]
MSTSEKLPGRRFAGQDIAIDLGTSFTRIYAKGLGVVVNEPSVVAINAVSHSMIAVGFEAKEMIGRTPGNVVTVKPLKDGVSSDFDVTERMLHHFISLTGERHFFAKPRMVISVPVDTTIVEKRAVVDAAVQAGAGKVFLIEEPLAAAIGAGLSIHESTGQMIVDIGAGTTEAVVISLGGIVLSKSIRVGGDEIDHEIINGLKRYFGVSVGERTAEAVKIRIGSMFDSGPVHDKCEIKGLDQSSGLPESIVVTGEDLRLYIEEPVCRIINTVKDALERTPPELSGDIVENGITLTGGGALMGGIKDRICNETGITVKVVDNPLMSVVKGIGKCLEDFKSMKMVMTSSGY